MSKPDGGPAFQSEEEGHDNPMYHSPDITLRDYFAAKALACVPEMWKGKARVSAKLAYDIADAMLEARDK